MITTPLGTPPGEESMTARNTPGHKPQVWIVEDSAAYRETIQELFDEIDDVDLAQGFESGEALFGHLNQNLAPDLILVDVGLPGLDGIEVVQRLHQVAPATALVMLTQHEDNDRIFQAICGGACGYLLKTALPQEIVRATREALGGGAPMTPQIARRVLNLFTQIRAPAWDYDLTDREQEVLRELIDGKTKRDMGKALFVSEHTIDTHLRNIYAKLHVHSRTEAVVKAIKENLVSLDG
ncbi:MAG TPA: response regulator transcription factor [Longimicrobiales bacterium]|nr:response regulator transcription factor [Longimicrobiales bacterium]